MIVPKSPTYRRSAMLTLGNRSLNESNWTCSVKFSRYCHFMIMLDCFLTLSMQQGPCSCSTTVLFQTCSYCFLHIPDNQIPTHFTGSCGEGCHIRADLKCHKSWHFKSHQVILKAWYLWRVCHELRYVKSDGTGGNWLIYLTVLDPNIKLGYIKEHWGPDFVLHIRAILVLRLSWVFCQTSAGSYEHFRKQYETRQYMPDELPKLKAKWIASAIRTPWKQLQGNCSWKYKRTKLRYYHDTVVILKLIPNKVQTQLYYEMLQLSSNSKSPSSHRGWNMHTVLHNNNNTALRHYLPGAPYWSSLPPGHMPGAYNTCPR